MGGGPEFKDVCGIRHTTSQTQMVDVEDIVQDWLHTLPCDLVATINTFINALIQKKEDYLAHKDKSSYEPEYERLLYTSNTSTGRGAAEASMSNEDIAFHLSRAIGALLESARQNPIHLSTQPPNIDVDELHDRITKIYRANNSNIKDCSFAEDVLKWVAAHPYQTAFHVACALLLLYPGIVTVPILALVGFAPEGIIAGSLAAEYQAIAGPIAARSFFAYLQSAGAGGYGLRAVYAVIRGGIAVAEAFEVGRAIVQKGHDDAEKSSANGAFAYGD